MIENHEYTNFTKGSEQENTISDHFAISTVYVLSMELPDEENVWDSVFEERQLSEVVRDQGPNDLERPAAHKEPIATEQPLGNKLENQKDDDDDEYIRKVRTAVEQFEKAGFFEDLDDTKKGSKTKAMVYKLADEVIARHKDKLLRIRDPNYDKWSEPLKTPMIDKYHEIKEEWRREETNHGSSSLNNSSMTTQNVTFAWSSNAHRPELTAPKKPLEPHSNKKSTNEILRSKAMKSAHELRSKQILLNKLRDKNDRNNLPSQDGDDVKPKFKMDPLEPFVAKALPREKKKRPKEKRKSKFWFWGSLTHHTDEGNHRDKARSPELEDYKIGVVSPNSRSPTLSIPFSDPDNTQTITNNAVSDNINHHLSLIDLDDDEEHLKCSTPPLIL